MMLNCSFIISISWIVVVVVVVVTLDRFPLNEEHSMPLLLFFQFFHYSLRNLSHTFFLPFFFASLVSFFNSSLLFFLVPVLGFAVGHILRCLPVHRVFTRLYFSPCVVPFICRYSAAEGTLLCDVAAWRQFLMV